MTRITADWLNAPNAQAVCSILAKAGHQAWFVGGCVRNALIGAPVSDLDISTDAHPDKVMQLAERAGLKAVPTGIDHGTVTVIADGVPFEITTFRRDVETDGRRAVVAFAQTMEEDAHRRDFTMNALYAGTDGVVVDPLGGLSDLTARRVRFIDDPQARIREDYLRILRFFRFHAWYGGVKGGLDPEGYAACAELSDGITGLSRERIGAEMRKMLAAPDPAPAVASMQMAGVLMRILPGADAAALAPLVHVESQLGLTPDSITRLAALGGEDVAKALRLSKADERRRDLLRAGITNGQGAAELGYRLGNTDAMAILALRCALQLEHPKADWADVVAGASVRKFPVRADDLMPAWSGAALGATLKELEQKWIESGFTLDKASLLKAVE